MDLTAIVAEIKAEARQPAIIISAHEKTLDALVALANRVVALEAKLAEKEQKRK